MKRLCPVGRLPRIVLLAALCSIGTPYTVHGTRGVADEIGVLVLAHGGSAGWNRTIEETVSAAQLTYPTEIAFGMGMHPSEVQAMQRSVNTLEQRGVRRIVLVPLLISSSSDVMRQFQYVFGLRDHGP